MVKAERTSMIIVAWAGELVIVSLPGQDLTLVQSNHSTPYPVYAKEPRSCLGNPYAVEHTLWIGIPKQRLGS